ncbi:MAG: M50 family metallopeptidase [Endomicrobiia bacterium]|nr:M50 family metallopeptidase [Endomicrobiaceae bacterium]MDD3922110.1 M50 family metallopeptidase [Endomicrobiaceae bacterium]
MTFFSGAYSTLLQICAVLFGLGLLIFIHELGHFAMAKFYKVRVLKFAFGFGKELFGFTRGETRYSICLFPFGGMVAMAGENPDEASGQEGEYLSLAWYKKIMIAFLGPLMNYILAIFLFAFCFSLWGITTVSDEAFIGALAPEQCAQKAGLQVGDRILSIAGVEVRNWEDIINNLKDKAEKQTDVSVLRNNEKLDFSFVIDKNPNTGIGMLGIQPKITREEVPFFKTLPLGLQTAIFQSTFTLVYLWDRIVTWEKPELAGPIGVMQVMAKSAKSGMESYIKLLAVISVALGLFNLLPIPLVDGGMIVLFLVEGLIRKRVSLKIIQVYNTIGLSIILVIFLFATYSDLIRLGIGKLFQ